MLNLILLHQVSTCGMSEIIGPIYIKDKTSSEMQSRIDAEVCF